MSETVNKLRLLARSEMNVVRIDAQRVSMRVGASVLATLLMLTAMLMINLAAFFALSESQSQATAAALVALGNLLLAMMVFAIARRMRPMSQQRQMATEIRDLAYREVSADVEDLQRSINELSTEVRSIRASVAGITGAVGYLIKGLSRSKHDRP
ncbi:hypothetical protein OAS86_05225 [Gammaproteobacteria bacterium]|nr:hypothetical protein [Gammaproteobacteria bacterium]